MAEIKKDFMLKRSMMKKWYTSEKFQNRWVVLTTDVLKYCDGPPEVGPQKEKGRIQLAAIKVVEHVDHEAFSLPNTFQVVYYEEGQVLTLYITCQYRQQREDWVEAVRKAAIAKKAEFWSKYHSGAWIEKQGQFTCCYQLSKIAVGCKTSECGPPETPPASKTHQLPLPSKRGHSKSGPLRSESASRAGDLKAAGTPSGLAESHRSNSLPRKPRDRRSIPAEIPLLPPKIVAPKTGRTVVALFDYKAIEEADLDLRQGLEYEVIDDSDEHWWKVMTASGENGWIPKNYVQEISEAGLENYGWYFKNITRVQAEAILKAEGTEGCFLVRDSTQAGKYTLSVYTGQGGKQVQHYHIQEDDNNLYHFTKKYKFDSVPLLIAHHSRHTSGLITRLSQPPSERKSSIKGDENFLRKGKWKINAEDLTINSILGKGEFATVHKGTLRSNSQTLVVAVKIMKPDKMSQDEVLREASLMTQMKHPNLVMLYGVCSENDDFKIVTEYMKHGALQKYVERHQGLLKHDVPQLLDMCVQIASAMTYLEGKKFIHRDLAARNCLVGEGTIVKVCDFGLARFVIDDIYVSSQSRFPVRWASPEVLEKCNFSIKSDVWAFGILMWEIFSFGALPYGKQWNNGTVYEQVVLKNYRLQKPKACQSQVFDVMLSCWQQEPSHRPSFGHLLTNLETLQEN